MRLLPPVLPAATVGGARVSVIVPARDEAARLPRLLGSLPDGAEVVVVDDGSTDGTADVAAAHGATVVRLDGPPPGWAGKAWACARGVDVATGDVLVLLDADVWLSGDALGRLVAAHRRLAPGGLLSVEPFHETVRIHEQLSAVCNAVTVVAAGDGLAFGPCLVTTPEALDAAGGFETVRAETVEDVALALAYRRAGRPVRSLLGGDAVRFRMYPDGLGSLADGWTKNLAGGAGRAPVARSLAATAWVAAAMAVPLLPVTWLVVAWVVVALQLRWVLGHLGAFQWWAWALFPVTVTAFVALFLGSVWRRSVRREVRWRGRRVPV